MYKSVCFIYIETVQGVDARGSVNNLATVAILPASSDVPLTNFTLELQHALKAIGKFISYLLVKYSNRKNHYSVIH
jgi:hypothetical protein